VVSPRVPRGDGTGDQKRAAQIIEASRTLAVTESMSWLPEPEVGSVRLGAWSVPQLLRFAVLCTRLPVQRAYAQALAPRSVRALADSIGDSLVIFVTSRSVPVRIPPTFAIDFVDDLATNAESRASDATGLRSLFWRWEARRLRKHDSRLAKRARCSFAVSKTDAESIAPNVHVVPLAVQRPNVDQNVSPGTILFIGSLFYAPNSEAVEWICEQLVPELEHLGVDPRTIVVAGRRPDSRLVTLCAATNVRLIADPPDLEALLADALVSIAPLAIGSGVQFKVLSSLVAGVPVVMSYYANRGVGLVHEEQAMVVEREPKHFAIAISRLLKDEALRGSLIEGGLSFADRFLPKNVLLAWERELESALGSSSEVRALRSEIPESTGPGG
jgi:glycosyltransferase involved in cell wall biosynthesis